jgi:pyridoxine 4-dehydrogenase
MASIASRQVGTVGLGLMGMTWRPQQTSDEQAFATMKAAIAKGATFWSSGEFYGYPEPTMNLQLLHRYFTKYPQDADKVTLFVKGGSDLQTLYPKCSAADIKASVANCTRILAGTKKIDVFGPARIDHSVPIEETIGALAELVKDGTIGGIGLSEASATTIEKAYRVYPLALIEVEFSLWSTDVLTNGVVETAKKLNIPLVAYSPLGRGFLTGQIKSPADIPQGDMRLYFDRFQPEVSQAPKNISLPSLEVQLNLGIELLQEP